MLKCLSPTFMVAKGMGGFAYGGLTHRAYMVQSWFLVRFLTFFAFKLSLFRTLRRAIFISSPDAQGAFIISIT